MPAPSEPPAAVASEAVSEAGVRQQRDPASRAAAAARRRLEQDLRAAVAGERFVLHYQPRVALADGRILGAEALIRWPQGSRTLVPPGGFIPLAEQAGLITAIGGWVLRAACREAARWPDKAGIVAVNVSARQVHEGALLAQVAAALEASGLPPERLELELTESVMLDLNEDTLLRLAAVRDLGIGLALDDFGTGYASLAMVRHLPLSALKLDRSLVRGLPDDGEDAVIVRAIVETGHALGLQMVAEGIERAPQRDFLAAIGCDHGQGFLLGRAAPAAQLHEALARQAAEAALLTPG